MNILYLYNIILLLYLYYNLIKTANYVSAKPLTLIISQMLYSGIFPEQLKVSKIIPLYKANDKMSNEL